MPPRIPDEHAQRPPQCRPVHMCFEGIPKLVEKATAWNNAAAISPEKMKYFRLCAICRIRLCRLGMSQFIASRSGLLERGKTKQAGTHLAFRSTRVTRAYILHSHTVTGL